MVASLRNLTFLVFVLSTSFVASCTPEEPAGDDTAISETGDSAYLGIRRRAPDSGWRVDLER